MTVTKRSSRLPLDAWCLACASALTVAGQHRILTGFPCQSRKTHLAMEYHEHRLTGRICQPSSQDIYQRPSAQVLIMDIPGEHPKAHDHGGFVELLPVFG